MIRKTRLQTVVRERRGSIALVTAITLLPLILIVGLSVDFGFYVQAWSQLSLGADAAAMYAVRTAAQSFAGGNPAAAITAGQTAGQQWFAAQVGQLSTAVVSPSNVTVSVTYTQNPGGFSYSVSYTGTVFSHLGAAFGFPSYAIGGSASAIVSNAYLEVLMLLDHSGSMFIGATLADIVTLEKATPCSTQAVTTNLPMSNYSWGYTSGYGYSTGNKPPPTTVNNGACDSRYTGSPSACFYPAIALASKLGADGQCTNGGGTAGVFGAHTPQAPCALACHQSSTNNDYYGLARSLGITLRLDVVEQAAANVIQTLQTKIQSPNQFLVGVYEFATNYTQVYPTSASVEAGTDLATALQVVQTLPPPLVYPGTGVTDFATSVKNLAAIIGNAGDGSTQAAPRKSIFIVTDGLQDLPSRAQGPMTSATNEQTCKLFKNKGINVYVLYTPYLPLANATYLGTDKQYVEPTTTGGTSAILAALQACASSTANFFQASDPAAINAAMQQMLQSALNTAGRVSK